MDVVRLTISNIGHSYRFLAMAIAFNSPFIEDYKQSHLYYLETYKKLTGKDFIFPKGIKKLI